MDLYQIDKLTDDMMNFCHDKFYDFLKIALGKDLYELFRIQSIRRMNSLKSITVDELIQILDYDITELRPLRKVLGYVSTDGKFHLQLGFRKLIEHLLLLVKSRNDTLITNSHINNDHMRNDIFQQLFALWNQSPSSYNDINVSIIIPWMKKYLREHEKIKKSVQL
ncbi:unnamed protein product [Adineta ricciae]|uniref:Uncharacterized protein n=1 Tax=Adineta ricciae TaxID=249248 RepID=A0A816DRS2_ADIRI|nr:unnamed protein product [Adineta ricciae]